MGHIQGPALPPLALPPPPTPPSRALARVIAAAQLRGLLGKEIHRGLYRCDRLVEDLAEYLSGVAPEASVLSPRQKLGRLATATAAATELAVLLAQLERTYARREAA